MPANNIAQWNGSAWSALGSGMDPNGWVEALALIGTNLYAGGYFGTAGGVPANYIAKWDGATWSALGSGIAGYDSCHVGALGVLETNLYVSGYFTTAGGLPVNGIAKWDGSAWSALGSGTGGYALAASGSSLYVGGNFTTAAGVTANNIAKWDGSAWSALGSGVTGGWPGAPCVLALTADGLGHLFVGGSFVWAGTNVSPYIAQANVGSAPTIVRPPETQTAEAGAAVCLAVHAASDLPLAYEWCFNGTNILSCTSSCLVLPNLLLSDSGTYMVVVSNSLGAVTSAPVALNVIPAVQRRSVPGIKLIGQPGNSWDVVYADSLGLAPVWTLLGSVRLTSTPQYYFDVTQPLPPKRFYRASQTTDPFVLPVLDLHMVPAITLTGNIGNSVRVDAINRIGPIDAWVTLDTVTLTNTSQLYFDVSAPGQPERLYRLVPSP